MPASDHLQLSLFNMKAERVPQFGPQQKAPSARPIEQGEQLRMFMQPREIISQYELSDQLGGETVKRLMGRKIREAEKPDYTDWGHDADPGESLVSSIHREGIKRPLYVSHMYPYKEGRPGKGMLLNGHHRLAVAARDMPDQYVPVEHGGSPEYDYRIEGWHPSEGAPMRDVSRKSWPG